MRRRIAALAIFLLTALPLCGCWNYSEVDSLSIVAGLAVDSGQEGRKYHVTIDIADTSHAGKDKPVETALLESDGDTILEAIQIASKRNGQALYWQNCQIVVISREIAEDSLLPIIEFFTRDTETRITIEMFVSGEQTAREILATKPSSMSIKSFEIDKIFEQNEEKMPAAKYEKLYEINNTLASEGASVTLPYLRHVQNGESQVCEIGGMSLFRKDRLAGSLTQQDSMYALFVMDHIRGGILNVKASTGNPISSMQIHSNKTTVRPVMENGNLRFTVHTETKVSLLEMEEQADEVGKERFDGFVAAAETQLKSEIVRVIGLVQEQQGLDIFGFGEALHRSDPDTWYQVRERWNDVFRTVPVEVSCKVAIMNSGERNKPVKVGGGP